MSSALVFLNYLKWHYSRALWEFSFIYKNLIKFIYHFFSLPLLIETFFAPWRRLGEGYPKDFMQLEAVLTTLVINSLMRLVGIFMRSIIISLGFICLLAVLLLYPLVVLMWLVLPLVSLGFLIIGFDLIFLAW